ncbi:hypothetical protein MMC10_009834 [Thelotrema lepadinum]|nr:hypothetical protein [Thelotrema lepadinum]
MADPKGFAPRLSIPSELLNLEPDETNVDYQGRMSTVFYEPRFEPLLRAVETQEPNFRFEGVDIVTGLGNLRGLYHLCSGYIGLGKADIRIDIEVVGDIIFLSRWNSSTLRSPPRGYGLGFEDHCTVKRNCKQTKLATYHRILNYQLGGMNFIVQFESDASMDERETWPGSFELLNEPCAIPHSRLLVHKIGELVNSESIIEIKSQAKMNNLLTDDILAQLYFSGTTRMLLGRHSKGQFKPDDIELWDMKSHIQSWVNRNQRQFGALYKLLHSIRVQVVEERRKTGCKNFTLLGEVHNIRLFRRGNGTSMISGEFTRVALEDERKRV